MGELLRSLNPFVERQALLNMVVAFHFAANKNDEAKVENTRAAFDAITATANASSEAATGKPDDPVHMVEEAKS